MKRNFLGYSVALAAAALVLGSAPPTRGGEVNIIPVVTISGEWSDNVFFSSTDQQSDTFLLVNPGVSFDYASKATALSLAYQVGFQRYTTFNERDNTVQRLDGTVGFNIGKGWKLNVGDNLVAANDPLAFDASGDRVQRDSFVYNHFSPGLNYQFKGRDVFIEGKYDRVDVDYDTNIDSNQSGFIGKIGTRLGAKSTARFEYIEFRRNFAQESQFVEDYRGRRLGLAVDRQLNTRLAMRFALGWEQRVFDKQNSPSNDFSSGVGGFELTGEFPGYFSVTGGITRRLNDLAVEGVYTVDRFNLELRRTFADRMRASMDAFYQKMKNDQMNEKADYTGFSLKGEYLLAKFLNAYVGYEYLDRNSTEGGIDAYTENRINFGVTVSYGL